MAIRALSRLSALRVAKVKDPGLYEDGGGLRLVVTDKGTKRWAVRLTVKGRRLEKGLGVYPDVSLDAARRRASELRQAAKAGIDLLQEEKAAILRPTVTFTAAFEQFFAVRRQRLSNGKHVQQWENKMRTYVFPSIGDLPVADIGPAELLEILTPIWFEKPETASRVLQRIKATFDSAILRGFREKANPCTGIAAELGASHRKVEHHSAIPWQEVPSFFASLDSREMQPSSRLLFKFLILTACRSGEARGATWDEVNFDDRTWIVPAERMKVGVRHVVPLSEEAIGVLAPKIMRLPSNGIGWFLAGSMRCLLNWSSARFGGSHSIGGIDLGNSMNVYGAAAGMLGCVECGVGMAQDRARRCR